MKSNEFIKARGEQLIRLLLEKSLLHKNEIITTNNSSTVE
jgi:hypothetical protein